MQAANKLFFVRAETADGENLDLLVVAADKEQAQGFWAEHYEQPEGAEVKWTGVVPGVAAPTEPGPIDWEAVRMD